MSKVEITDNRAEPRKVAVLPFLAFKYGEYRRKKVLETGE